MFVAFGANALQLLFAFGGERAPTRLKEHKKKATGFPVACTDGTLIT